jgi:hypothetical protein
MSTYVDYGSALAEAQKVRNHDWKAASASMCSLDNSEPIFMHPPTTTLWLCSWLCTLAQTKFGEEPMLRYLTAMFETGFHVSYRGTISIPTDVDAA